MTKSDPVPENTPTDARWRGADVSAPRDGVVDLVRVVLTLLVIAHHAVLAYHLYAPPAGTFTRVNIIWGAFPVVDAARSPGVDALTLWNDSFFMALFFLLAGAFVPSSLTRKGAGKFFRDRLVRLGIPFVGAAALLAPLAYYPAYLQRADATGHPGFWNAWVELGVWPAGPAWFLWVLLAFSGLAVALWVSVPRAFGWLGRWGGWCRERPAQACAVFSGLAILSYLPTCGWVSPFDWATWGPFTVQTGRIVLYAAYFVFGCALGAGNRETLGAWLRSDGPLARRWISWQVVAGVVFMSFVAALIVWVTLNGKGQPSTLVAVIATVLFSLTGVTTAFALLAYVARKPRCPGPVLTSLARNAFGMYLVHYAIVTWLQWALLGVDWPGFAKAVAVTATAIAASWAVAAGLRRVPGLSRVL